MKKHSIPKGIDQMGADFEKHIQNGFRVCGLFPFDKNQVDYSKLVSHSNKVTRRPPEKRIFTRKMDNVKFIESRIQADILEAFRTCYMTE